MQTERVPHLQTVAGRTAVGRTVAIGAVALAAVLAGCGVVPSQSQADVPRSVGSSAPATSSETPSSEPTPVPQPIVMTPSVLDKSKGVPVDTLVSVRASQGTLSKVALQYRATDKKTGKTETVKVSGQLNAAKSGWTATERLEPSATYTLVMRGVNASDRAATTAQTTFSTQKLTLDDQTFPSLFPLPDTTVGVGMPVVLTFDVPVKDRKEVEKHLTVTSAPDQPGSWHWYSDSEVHYRPKTYWKSGTKVAVEADLNGVDAGGGIYGQTSASTSFTIGRSVVTKINLASKQAKVYVDGDLARRIPVSGGKPGFISRSGSKLIMAKLAETRMASETIGIGEDSPEAYDLKVKYAMRVTSSGEFLHAAPWNGAKFGRVNASHGCIGMSTSDAQWLFNQVTIGDPVITTGTGRGLEQGNGWTDWDVPFSQYKKGSAL